MKLDFPDPLVTLDPLVWLDLTEMLVTLALMDFLEKLDSLADPVFLESRENED